MIDGHLILIRALTRTVSSQEVHDELEPIVARLNAAGVATECLVLHGEPAAGILRVAEEKPHSLIVMSTHGRSGLGRWLYGSVADEVLHSASSPLMLVSAACDNRWSMDRPFRVLIPLDGSPHSEEALTLVHRFHRPETSELFITRSVDDVTSEISEWNDPEAPFEVPEIRVAHEYLSDIAEPLRQKGYTVHQRVSREEPAVAIARFARESGADLVAMATHGRHGASRLILGSVATGTLHRAHIPLLLTRPTAPTVPSEVGTLTHAV